ncbi:MAG: heme-binding domain-containing protein [Bacteroidota bacterium]
MRKPARIAVPLLIGIVVVMQFFQPEKNQGEATESDMVSMLEAPERVADVLKNSCYDCHSNHTEYPWYSRISPVSWFMNMHVTSGREELSFSEYGKLEKSGQIGVLSDICDVVESGSMPLKSYLLMHGNARLDQAAKEALCDWTDEEAMKMLRKD